MGEQRKTEIKKLETNALSFRDEFSRADAITNKWKDNVPNAETQEGDALCRAGAREALKLRQDIIGKWKGVKVHVDTFVKEGDDTINGVVEQLKGTEKSLRDSYKAAEKKKAEEKERRRREEAERIEQLKGTLNAFNAFGVVDYGTPLEVIQDRFDELSSITICKNEYDEFTAGCIVARDSSLARLDSIIKSEKERLAREKEEKERKEKEEAERREREEKERKEREEEQRKRDEEEAERQRKRREEEAELERQREEIRAQKAKIEAEKRKLREEEEARKAEAERTRKEEERKRAEEEQRRQDEKLAQERARQEKELNEKREKEAKEERIRFEEIQRKNREELLHTLNDMDAKGEFTPEYVCDAIICGTLPKVEYTG